MNPARFYKRPATLRALARVVPRRSTGADDGAPPPAPPLAWRSHAELCRLAEDLGIEPARMTRAELLDAIRDNVTPARARAMGLRPAL